MPVVIAFGSFVTTLLGGVAALRIGDRRHLVLGLAAGLMLGVVLFDLLPEALGEQPAHLFGVPAVMLTAMAGFLTLHVIERSAPPSRPAPPWRRSWPSRLSATTSPTASTPTRSPRCTATTAAGR